ncbi:MAG TPA: hypothetical protein VMG60_07430 [Burkholderiaceae bacterium]|nr:hypothetical protein [Burkholderiaceae bacterium]
MKSSYYRVPRTTPAGVATASILLVALVLAASLLFDSLPLGSTSGVGFAQTSAHANS